jgi:signal transduction histidine kinase
VALGAADRIKGYALFWAATALVMALVMGTFLARGIARPVADLSEAARALTEGRYDRTADERGGGELGELARAFNQMASQVRRRDEEIRIWNAELQARVEAATAKLRAAHDQVARTRRLAAVGSLGAGVAHALNNPLTSIIGLTSLAKRQLVAGSETAQLLDETLAEAQRAAGVVRQLRALTEEERRAGGDRFPLEKPLRAALDAQRGKLRERGVDLRVTVAADLPPMQGDAAQIEQLVTHLVDNAATAMPAGGHLAVSVSAVEGNALRLSVADTGPGIPGDIRERIFDPFFTTKPVGKGTGLGLSLSYGIVKKHRGRIEVTSEPGRGSAFRVFLPVVQNVPDETLSPPRAAPSHPVPIAPG